MVMRQVTDTHVQWGELHLPWLLLDWNWKIQWKIMLVQNSQFWGCVQETKSGNWCREVAWGTHFGSHWSVRKTGLIKIRSYWETKWKRQKNSIKNTGYPTGRFQKLECELHEDERVIADLVDCIAHLTTTMKICQQLHEFTIHLISLYTHVKSYSCRFNASKMAIFSTLLSLAAGCIKPRFFLPIQPASIVSEIPNDEFLSTTKVSSAIRVGDEAIFH